MNPNRTNRLAVLLLIAGCLLLASYVGAYHALATRSLPGDGFLYVGFDTEWLCTLYYPAVMVDSVIHRRPAMLCYPTSPITANCCIVNER